MATQTRSRVGRRTANVPIGTDLGLLIVRVLIGGLFIGHGTGKLFGWWGEGGVKGTGAFFESVGYKPGEKFAIFAGIVETGAGVLLVLGLLIPLAAAIIIGDMMNAAWVKSAAGFWVADQGYEYEFVLIFLMLALTITGAGAYALDRNRDWFGSRARGVAVAVVLGLLGGIIMLFVRQ
jgi:putative oxidoreductase